MRVIHLETEYLEEADNHILNKWGVDGKVSFKKLGEAEIAMRGVIGRYTIETLRAARAHEAGHVDFFEDRMLNEPDLKLEDFAKGDTWQLEVDAWLRALDVPFKLKVGKFALDCLWTYKVGCNVSNEAWWEVKDMLADMCEQPEELRKYKPLPMPKNAPPPKPPVEVEGEEWEDTGQDSGQRDEPWDGEDYTPPGSDEEEPRPGQETPEDWGKGEKREDGPQGHDDQPYDPVSARDKWLESPEALPPLLSGRTGLLKAALRDAGHSPDGPLPLVPAAIFKKAGGMWQS